MFEYLVPYMYLWPALWLLLLIILIIICFNLFLAFGLSIIYYLTPDSEIDSILNSITKTIKNIFSFYFEKTESNIKKTFKIKSKEKIPEKSILIWHPHGLMTVACAIHNGFGITDPIYSPTKIATLNFLHKIPICKDAMRISNTISADYYVLKNTLEKESISIMLGGVKEVLNTIPYKLILTIKERKGIFKLALETGSYLVPVITYGENELFPPAKNQIIEFINLILYSLFKVALPFPTIESLQKWFKLCYEPLDPITTYTGLPIKVEKVENPSNEDIENLRNIYIQKVEELFKETNSGEYSLVIA